MQGPSAGAAGSFVSLPPARVLDSRANTGVTGPIKAGATASFQVLNKGGVPATGVSAVIINITVVAPATAGYLTAWAAGAAKPAASNLNFSAGQTIPNLVVVPVGAGGKVSLYNGSTGTIGVLGDIAGYFLAGTATVPGAFTSLAPARVLDSRANTGVTGPMKAGATASFQVLNKGGVLSLIHI